jgi:EAL domain-containing protein (putative c-di-GMP-specific phosphodiesterase class I)
VLLERVTDAEAAATVAGRVLDTLHQPFGLNGRMLKIDKAFVDGIGKGREDTALAHAIVKLSHTLQLHTVAEGIEQAEQAAHLASLGCQDGQGFLFARPLNPEAMTELLAKSLADGGFYLPVAQNLEAAVGT